MHTQIPFHTSPFTPGHSSSPSSADRVSSSRWHLQSVSIVSCWGLRSSCHLSPALLVMEALSFLLVWPAPDCSSSFLTQLLEKVEVVSHSAGEKRRKNRIFTLAFWKLESREKLKIMTWGQNAWLSSYRVEQDRFIPITTLWPVSRMELPALVMCSGFRRTSPSLAFSLQHCEKKGITEELAALREICLR